MNKNKKNFGFTLIELLVAMTIFSMMMAIALVSYQATRKSARDGKRKTDVEQIRSALEMYKADNGYYPQDTLVSGQDIGEYLTIPADPDSTNRNYYYTDLGNGEYAVCAALENPVLESTNCGSGCGLACNYQVNNP